jgi:hypothetical protein
MRRQARLRYTICTKNALQYTASACDLDGNESNITNNQVEIEKKRDAFGGNLVPLGNNRVLFT